MTKLNAAGSALVYSTYLGGSDTTGRQRSRSTARAAPTSRAAPARRTSRRPRAPSTRASTAGDDAFVTKLNAAGSALAYSTYLGGSGSDDGLRDRGRRRGQRLRHRRHRLDGLPDHRGRLRHDLQRRHRRLRDEARPRRWASAASASTTTATAAARYAHAHSAGERERVRPGQQRLSGFAQGVVGRVHDLDHELAGRDRLR